MGFRRLKTILQLSVTYILAAETWVRLRDVRIGSAGRYRNTRGAGHMERASVGAISISKAFSITA
jgi:hypothetical protein